MSEITASIDSLPQYVSLIFIATTLLAVYLFFLAAKKSIPALAIILLWMILQGMLAYIGFYKTVNTIPPRFIFLVAPPLLVILFLFLTKKGKAFIDGMNLKTLTLLHIIRIPVEIVLWLLCLYKFVPELMTFGGRNFDIASGITAPLIWYFGFVKNSLNRKFILAWNFICLGLLFNIVINAALSAPSFIQQFAFDQPNIAILFFPFIWLPCCVVPVVLLSHLASVRQLLKRP
jgi:hypothetical protein